MDKILLTMLLKYRRWADVYDALQRRVNVSMEDIERADRWLEDLGMEFISLLDENYPEYWEKQYNPPFGLFYGKGSDRYYLPEEIFINKKYAFKESYRRGK